MHGPLNVRLYGFGTDSERFDVDSPENRARNPGHWMFFGNVTRPVAAAPDRLFPLT